MSSGLCPERKKRCARRRGDPARAAGKSLPTLREPFARARARVTIGNTGHGTHMCTLRCGPSTANGQMLQMPASQGQASPRPMLPSSPRAEKLRLLGKVGAKSPLRCLLRAALQGSKLRRLGRVATGFAIKSGLTDRNGVFSTLRQRWELETHVAEEYQISDVLKADFLVSPWCQGARLHLKPRSLQGGAICMEDTTHGRPVSPG